MLNSLRLVFGCSECRCVDAFHGDKKCACAVLFDLRITVKLE